MPASNYPNGFVHGITIRGVPIQQMYPGEVFWVNGSSVVAKNGVGGSNSNPGTYQKPFGTIDYAIGRCTASRGDIIMVMPGHTETVETDGGLACDVAGIAIVGLGTGTLRPVVLLDTAAAAAVTVSAANVTLMNLEFRASFADVTNAIDVTAAWCSVIDCEFTEEGADLNFLDYIHCSSTTNNNADGLHVEECVGTAVDAAQNSFVNIKADLDRLTVKNNVYSSAHANTLAMVLCATGKDLTDCVISGNLMNAPGKASGDMLIDNDTTVNTGIVADNLIGHGDTETEVLIDADGVRVFANYGTAVTTASGYLLPAVDS